MDKQALKLSVELERESDLFAAAGNLSRALPPLREANAIRARIFGHKEVNTLREQTHEALGL